METVAEQRAELLLLRGEREYHITTDVEAEALQAPSLMPPLAWGERGPVVQAQILALQARNRALEDELRFSVKSASKLTQAFFLFLAHPGPSAILAPE